MNELKTFQSGGNVGGIQVEDTVLGRDHLVHKQFLKSLVPVQQSTGIVWSVEFTFLAIGSAGGSSRLRTVFKTLSTFLFAVNFVGDLFKGLGDWALLVNNGLIPLFLSLAVQKSDNDKRHVITTNTRATGGWSQTDINHTFSDFRQGETVMNTLSDNLNNLLRGKTVPNTITSQDYEFIVRGDFVFNDVWESGDDLFFSWQLSRLLEVKVTNGSGQGQVTIDSAHIDEPTCSTDSGMFTFVVWLMVKGQSLSVTVDR
ncbi:hypothetical protein WICPIJ_009186 [Wickerhamomyces pijperi]|uniref:Uncharacterized protein n=1 Tax=Wickerhamomyces pijperi TaxID=599730 RepID=A0A9P8PQ99_WICPI|nr:hypothetical protein WICPIJ_009186 [Wickerhamomyces pijperi]